MLLNFIYAYWTLLHIKIFHFWFVLGDLASLKDQSFAIKEGTNYRLKMSFCVQREIVTGLKLVMKTSRKGIKGKFESQVTGVT